MICMKAWLSIALLVVPLLAAAEDKPKKPELTEAQKVTLLKAERDIFVAREKAQAFELALRKTITDLESTRQAILKDLKIDDSKWSLDLETLEFSEIKPTAPPAKQ